MNAQKQVRHHRVVIRAPAIIVFHPGADWRCARASAHRDALVVRGKLEITTQKRTIGEIVGGALIRDAAREFRMYDGAVQAFRVVLEHQLPVCAHVVGGAVDGPKSGEREAIEAFLEGRKPSCKRLWRPGHVYEQKPARLGMPALPRHTSGT